MDRLPATLTDQGPFSDGQQRARKKHPQSCGLGLLSYFPCLHGLGLLLVLVIYRYPLKLDRCKFCTS